MTDAPAEYTWSPLPGRLPEDLAQAFAVYSLKREVEQTSLVFFAFAFLSGSNLSIDLIFGVHDFVLLNGFFLVLALAAAFFMRLVTEHRLLTYLVNAVAFLVFSAIIIAKQSAVSTEIWFMYLADLMIIAAICLTVPVNILFKAGYSTVIVLLNIQSLGQSTISPEIQAGVVLLLLSTMAFALIVYYKMQQAHFSAFMSLRKEQQMNEQLRSAQNQIGQLQELLPVCSSCKAVRDDNGYWEQIDKYIQDHLDVNVSHGLCPDCSAEMYPGVNRKQSSE